MIVRNTKLRLTTQKAKSCSPVYQILLPLGADFCHYATEMVIRYIF